MPTWDDLGATRISPLVAYTTDTTGDVTIWHWCTAAGDWTPTTIPPPGIATAQPLTLTETLDWTACCGLQGRVRGGRWAPA